MLGRTMADEIDETGKLEQWAQELCTLLGHLRQGRLEDDDWAVAARVVRNAIAEEAAAGASVLEVSDDEAVALGGESTGACSEPNRGAPEGSSRQ
jgi:hypothetical protein